MQNQRRALFWNTDLVCFELQVAVAAAVHGVLLIGFSACIQAAASNRPEREPSNFACTSRRRLRVAGTFRMQCHGWFGSQSCAAGFGFTCQNWRRGRSRRIGVTDMSQTVLVGKEPGSCSLWLAAHWHGPWFPICLRQAWPFDFRGLPGTREAGVGRGWRNLQLGWRLRAACEKHVAMHWISLVSS